ncbi:MAG: cadherin-like beta sandwich domain-containing protein, partial [Acidimicrobiaceae bacterium]|nr:cadherin-like beta sandwich domain-containing protein [Acidimicrobiaceae bacterium]
TVSPASRTFTPANWDTAQKFTVTGVAAGTSTITHAATSSDTDYSGETVASVTATVTAAAPTTLRLSTNATNNTAAEGGGPVTVTATLNRAATAAVSVTLTATGTATSGSDYTLPGAFTIAAGQTTGTGTVSITDDDLDEGNETVILTTSVSGLTITGVTLTITDDDTHGVTVNKTAVSVAEGATAEYTVVLDSKPTADVTVTPTSGSTAKATVSPASRTFTPANWDTAQSFTVTGVAAGTSSISHAATSSDSDYSGETVAAVTATVTRAQQSSDADLSGLTATFSTFDSTAFTALSFGAFASGTTTYAATVPNQVDEVKLRPTVAESNASVEVGKQGQTLAAVTSGQESAAISLAVGANAITVKVTAQDGSTTKTYTVTVTREEAQAQNHPALTGLRVTSGDGRLDVSWSPPPASVGTVGAYEVQYTSSATVSDADAASGSQTDPAAGWVVALGSAAASTTPSHMITGLTSGTAYRVRVAYFLSDLTASDWAYATATLAGPDVSTWNPTVFVQELGGDRYGCRSGVTVSAVPGRSGGAECSVSANFDGNAFSVSHVRFGTRGYRVLDLYIEPHRRTSWGETAYRVVLRVDDDSGTAELGRGMTLVLTTPGVTEKRLAFDAAERDGNTFRWPLLFEDGGLGWDQGWVRGVKVRIHQFTAGLDYVRVHYDEMRGGQPVNGFAAWRPAGVSAYFHRGLLAYIPGQFTSSDPEQGMLTTTHAKLWVGASHSGSTLEWAIGNVDGATGSFAALAADQLTPAIALDPASKWTYVYVRVTNGAQVATHVVAIDPPPRTYTLTPKAGVTEGEEATLTVSLGSPAGAGGVSFTVSADYGDGGATAEDVGQFATAVTVPEGQQSVRIIIPTVDDEAVEEDEERFTVRVAHVGEPAWAVDPEGTATAVVTIVDNDEPPAPPEGPEPWNIRVVPGDGTLTVTWNVGSRD